MKPMKVELSIKPETQKFIQKLLTQILTQWGYTNAILDCKTKGIPTVQDHQQEHGTGGGVIKNP